MEPEKEATTAEVKQLSTQPVDEPESKKFTSTKAEAIPPSELTMKERLALFSKFQVTKAPTTTIDPAPGQQSKDVRALEKPKAEQETEVIEPQDGPCKDVKADA